MLGTYKVPCCVYAAEFPRRKLARSGEWVRTYEQLLEYLHGLDTRIRREDLDFEGKRTVLFMTAEDACKSLVDRANEESSKARPIPLRGPD